MVLQDIVDISSLSETKKQDEEEELSLKHIVFGIARSSQLWTCRKEFVKLWWQLAEMLVMVFEDISQLLLSVIVRCCCCRR